MAACVRKSAIPYAAACLGALRLTLYDGSVEDSAAFLSQTPHQKDVYEHRLLVGEVGHLLSRHAALSPRTLHQTRPPPVGLPSLIPRPGRQNLGCRVTILKRQDDERAFGDVRCVCHLRRHVDDPALPFRFNVSDHASSPFPKFASRYWIKSAPPPRLCAPSLEHWQATTQSLFEFEMMTLSHALVEAVWIPHPDPPAIRAVRVVFPLVRSAPLFSIFF